MVVEIFTLKVNKKDIYVGLVTNPKNVSKIYIKLEK